MLFISRGYISFTLKLRLKGKKPFSLGRKLTPRVRGQGQRSRAIDIIEKNPFREEKKAP